ncbi:MAG: hypothetical protein ABJC13_01260 [Acidobacteriota bacterium]
MSETAQALERMTDEGKFEELAGAVLRSCSYPGLNDTGRNSQGKTIKSPVDGVYRVPGSYPSHYVIAHHTTVKLKGLRGKWLNKEAGDVGKAARWAEDRRRQEPGTRVTLVLTCNRRVSEGLIAEVGRTCSQGGLEEDIWSVLRLQEFLDRDPSGQRIREDCLGVHQERLDEHLLRELGERSCGAYAERELFGACLDERVARALDAELSDFVTRGRSGSVTFLVGSSGHGKTTAAHNLLRGHLAGGGLGLWFEPDTLQRSSSIEAAIEDTLRGLRPKIESGCGSIAIGLARKHGDLLLVVDDVNRTTSPAELIQKVASWNWQGAPVGRSATASQENAGYQVLCPVWPQVLGQITDQAERTIQSLCFYTGPFSAEEGPTALLRRAKRAGMELTALQASDLSTRLGHEPLLISFWSEGSTGESPVPVPSQVIDRFIQKRLADLSRSDPGTGLPEEYEETLLHLSDQLLEEHVFNPSWPRVKAYFENHLGKLTQLRRLIDHKEVIRLEPSARERRLAFRHDRVRDHLLAKAIHRRMAVGGIPPAFLSDPYYAEVIGQALLLGDLDPSWATRIEQANPLALFYALRVFQQASSPMEKAVLEAILRWIQDEVVSDRCVKPLRWSVDQVLSETDSPHVVELTERFSSQWFGLWEARMRNGDVEAACKYSEWLGFRFLSSRMTLLARHAKEVFGDQFTRDLAALLERPNLSAEVRRGALYLAGLLGDPELAPAIVRCLEEGWYSADLVRAFLWAGLRCCSDPAPVLDPVLDFWGTLSDEGLENNLPSDRSAVIAYGGLTDALARFGANDLAIPYLLARATEQGGPLEWPLFVILRRLDHPDALEFCLRDKRGWDLSQYWNSGSMTRAAAIVRSRDRLRHIWEDEIEDTEARSRAFALWSLGSSEGEIAVLRAIGRDSPLHSQALRMRIELGDRSCAPEILWRLKTEEHSWTWWFHCERIWSRPLREALEGHFERRANQMERASAWQSFNEDWQISELLGRISPLEAEEILTRHWSHLRYSPEFVQTALSLGSSRAITLALEAVRECPEPKKIFEFINQGEFARRLEEDGTSPELSSRRLECLGPYIQLFDEQAIDWLWHVCNRKRLFSWRRKHVDDLLSENFRQRAGLSERDLVAELDNFVIKAKSRGFLRLWIDGFRQRGDPDTKAMRIVSSWLRERGTFEALQVAAECVALGGSRDDLALLEGAGFSAQEPRVATLLAATRFRVFRRSLS